MRISDWSSDVGSSDLQYMPMLQDAICTACGVRRMGAAALDLAWTACGRYDGYWEMGLAPWDVAAGTLILREAGGVCHDMHQQDPWPVGGRVVRSEEHTSELQSLMRISYAVFCLKKKKSTTQHQHNKQVNTIHNDHRTI